jgi:hypothetical protein
MAFVPAPRDLNKIKSKLVFGMSIRQLICFGSAAIIGVPAYIFTRTAIGNSAAVLLMIGLMLPFFFIAMYEKDGQPAEKVLRNFIRARIFFPCKRPYKTENLYKYIEDETRIKNANKSEITGKTPAKQHKTGKNK